MINEVYANGQNRAYAELSAYAGPEFAEKVAGVMGHVSDAGKYVKGTATGAAHTVAAAAKKAGNAAASPFKKKDFGEAKNPGEFPFFGKKKQQAHRDSVEHNRKRDEDMRTDSSRVKRNRILGGVGAGATAAGGVALGMSGGKKD